MSLLDLNRKQCDVFQIVLLYLDVKDWKRLQSITTIKIRNSTIRCALQKIKEKSYEDCTSQEATSWVFKYWDNIKYIRNPSEQNCLLAVQQNGYMLRYITDEAQSEKVKRFAVQENGNAIQYIKNPHEEICKLAVNQDGCAIRYINNPSQKVCKLAVQRDGGAIQYIKNPSQQVKLLAVQQNKDAIYYIK